MKSSEAMEQSNGVLFGQDEVNRLHVGLLMFNRDFFAIRDALLPERKVEDIVQFYCSTYIYTKAHAHVLWLEQAGFQPGCLVSGNMRNRIIKNISSATGRCLRSDRGIAGSFKSYDTCSLALVDLVEALVAEAGAATFGKAVYEELATCGVDMDQLILSEVCLDWDTLDDKMKHNPVLFDSAVWPALTNTGWKSEAPQQQRQQQQQEPASDGRGPNSQTSCNAPTAIIESGHALFVPPAAVVSEYLARVGEPLEACRSPSEVMEALRDAGQAVPATCVLSLREAECEEAIRQCMVMAGRDAPHRHAFDPASKRPGTPTTSRKFMCANCSINTSTVWRTGNAGLTLCNACGMFYNKHDHEHRPEHLIASARAKAEAQQLATAAAAAGTSGGGSPLHPSMRRGSGLRGYTPDVGHMDGEMSDDGGVRRGGGFMGASESGEEDEEGVRRPRTRRRAQVNKWLCSEDYLMLDGPLRTMSNPDFAAAAVGCYGSDDARYAPYDASRARYTTSPCFGSRSGQQPRRNNSGTRHFYNSADGAYYGRSRSVEPEYGYGYEGWQDDGGYEGQQDEDFSQRRRHSHYQQQQQQQQQQGRGYQQQQVMDWDAEDGPAVYAEEEEEEEGDEEWGQGEDQEQQPERALEDMETLLGRILLHSPSDASDSSAADALVAMSQSCLSHHEQHRLHAAISCDIRTGSASPGPTSAPSRGAIAAALAAAAAGSPLKGAAVGRGEWGSGAGGARDDQDAAGTDRQQQQRQDDGHPVEKDMEVDAAEQQAEAVQDGQGVEQHAGGAAASEDGIAQVWARIQALTRRDCHSGSGNSNSTPHSQSGGYDAGLSPFDGPARAAAEAAAEAAAGWYAGNDQQTQSAIDQYDATAADGGGIGYRYVFGSSQYSQQQYQQQQPGAAEFLSEELLAPRSLSGPHTGGLTDSGSRSASPTHAGRAGAGGAGGGSSGGGSSQPRQSGRGSHHAAVDEDYRVESKGKGRSISRFGAEHKQQMVDPYSVSRSAQQAATAPAKRSPVVNRSIRRTNTGEPQRCANCSSDQTCLWRRDKEDPTRTLCNACGIYKTNNGIDRPTNGLFPFWKNGRERVVRRNTARPYFKPYKHQVQTAEEYKAQRQQDEFMKANNKSAAAAVAAASRMAVAAAAAEISQQQLAAQQSNRQQDLQACGDIHPGALGLTVPPAAATAAATHMTAAEPAASVTDMQTAAPQAALASRGSLPAGYEALAAGAAAAVSSSAVALSAAVAAAAAAARARASSLSGQLNQVDVQDAAMAAEAPWPAPAAAAAAAQQQGGDGAANQQQQHGGSSTAEVVGWVQQMQLGAAAEVGVLGHLIHQAWSHAIRIGEPVMLTTGHKVFPDGRVIKCQVNNELGLSELPALSVISAGSQEIAATVAQVAAALSREAGTSGAGRMGSLKPEPAAKEQASAAGIAGAGATAANLQRT